MLRISRLTDYGTVLLAHLAGKHGTVCSAADVAAATGIALPTVSKLLKSLARADREQAAQVAGPCRPGDLHTRCERRL